MIDEWQPDLLVVGDPLNMDGSPSELSACGRASSPGGWTAAWDARGDGGRAAQQLRGQTGNGARPGHRGDYRDDPVDSLAAELILKTWLSDAPAEADYRRSGA